MHITRNNRLKTRSKQFSKKEKKKCKNVFFVFNVDFGRFNKLLKLLTVL